MSIKSFFSSSKILSQPLLFVLFFSSNLTATYEPAIMARIKGTKEIIQNCNNQDLIERVLLNLVRQLAIDHINMIKRLLNKTIPEIQRISLEKKLDKSVKYYNKYLSNLVNLTLKKQKIELYNLFIANIEDQNSFTSKETIFDIMDELSKKESTSGRKINYGVAEEITFDPEEENEISDEFSSSDEEPAQTSSRLNIRRKTYSLDDIAKNIYLKKDEVNTNPQSATKQPLPRNIDYASTYFSPWAFTALAWCQNKE